MKRLRFSLKHPSKVPSTPELDSNRRAWVVQNSDTHQDFVAIDETAFYVDCQPAKGYAPIGQRLPCQRKSARYNRKRLSVLVAVSTRGVLLYEVLDGSFNSTVLALQHISRTCNPCSSLKLTYWWIMCAFIILQLSKKSLKSPVLLQSTRHHIPQTSTQLKSSLLMSSALTKDYKTRTRFTAFRSQLTKWAQCTVLPLLNIRRTRWEDYCDDRSILYKHIRSPCYWAWYILTADKHKSAVAFNIDNGPCLTPVVMVVEKAEGT